MRVNQARKTAQTVALMGLLLALALTFSFIEMSIAPLLAMPPGVKLGLANVVGMYALFTIGAKSAVTITFLRAGFVFLVRGATAFLMSATGGLVSIFVLIILVKLVKLDMSLQFLSILGAVSHNIAQLFMMSFILKSSIFEYGPVFYYAPVLILSGVLVGFGTGTVLKTMMPLLARLNK